MQHEDKTITKEFWFLSTGLSLTRNIKIWAAAWDFQRFDILTCVDSDEPLQPPSKLRNSKWCSVSSLPIIEYSSDKQRLWSDCAYAQADLRLCWSHIPHCWKSHALAQNLSKALESFFQHFSRQILFSWIHINLHFQVLDKAFEWISSTFKADSINLHEFT